MYIIEYFDQKNKNELGDQSPNDSSLGRTVIFV